MNQDDWIKFQDKIPSEYRWVFDGTRDHDMGAYGSMLGVVLQALGTVEEKQDGFAHSFAALLVKLDLITEKADADRKDRATVTRFLERLDKQWEAVSTGLTALTAEFRDWRAGIEDRLDRKRVRIDALEVRVTALEVRATAVEVRLDARIPQVAP